MKKINKNAKIFLIIYILIHAILINFLNFNFSKFYKLIDITILFNISLIYISTFIIFKKNFEKYNTLTNFFILNTVICTILLINRYFLIIDENLKNNFLISLCYISSIYFYIVEIYLIKDANKILKKIKDIIYTIASVFTIFFLGLTNNIIIDETNFIVSLLIILFVFIVITNTILIFLKIYLGKSTSLK